MKTTTDPIQWLQFEYEQRKKENTRYSSRQFAKLLGVSSGRLSELLHGKRAITLAMAEKFAKALALEPFKENAIKKTIIDHKARAFKKSRIISNLKLIGNNQYKQLDQDVFELISNQHHYALLNLIELKNAVHSPQWFAKRLSISVQIVEQSLEVLMRLDLIKFEDGKYIRTHKKIKTTDDIESRAIKKAHRERLQHAIICLEKVPVEKRDVTSITCAIDANRIGEFKELIREFRRGLSDLMSKSETNEIYNLNIQLVPLTNIEEDK